MGGKIFIENVISDGLTGDLLILDGDGVPTTSSLLNYDGTTLTISGGNGTHIIRIASDSGGDSSVISSLASGSGTRFTSYNNAVNDFEPLQFVAEEISFSIRTGVGTSSEKFKFSTAGDLGISTTPVTWTNHRTMQIFLGAVSASTSQVALSYNTYYDGSDYRHTSTAASQLYTQDVVGHYWYAATSGTSGNVVAFVEKMSLRTSGVAIGGGFNPSAQLHVISTAEQLRLGYDTGNYTSFTVDSNGVLVIVPTALVAIGTGINLGNTADTTNGNIRYTGSDFEGRVGGNWMSFTGGGTSKWTDVGSGNIYRNSNVMIGATTDPSAALHVIKTSEQLRLGYDISNYATFGVASTGGINISSIGTSPYFVFSGDSSSASIESIVSNTNGNARGAVSAYYTQDTVRGYIGALKHGAAGYVLFTDETTDGFGIRAQTTLEFGISATGVGRWNSTGLAVGSLFNPASALHVIKTTEQMRIGYDSSKYLSFSVDAGGNSTVTQSTGFTWVFRNNTASNPSNFSIDNSNVNARGACVSFRTENVERGFIGAMRHGTAADVLFDGETVDGFGIRAQTVLEFGIGTTGIGRWNTTGLAIGSLFNPSAALHVIKTTEQLRLGYNGSNYTSFTVDSNGVLVIVPTALVAIGTGINLGNTADTTNGNIRYTGSDFEGRVGGNWMSFTGGGGTSKWTDVGSGNIYRNSNVMVGATTDPSAALHVIKTSEQLRLGYDASNYTSVTTNSSGNTTITPTGSIVFVKGLALTANGLGYGGGPTIAVSADQTIQIASGGAIDGIIHVTANGASGSIHQKVVLMVSAHQFDHFPIVQVLSNHTYMGKSPLMFNFRFQAQTTGDNLRYLVCDVGNRESQTINIYAVGVGISAGHVQLKLTPDTASPLTTIYGINVQRNGFVAFNNQTTTKPFAVGTTASDGNGAYLSMTGNWTTGSDRNKKNTIVDLRYGLNDIDLVNVVEFYYNGSEELQFGVVAQELQEIMPELVEGLEPNMSVKTVQLVFPLIKAVQELHAKVKALESTLN